MKFRRRTIFVPLLAVLALLLALFLLHRRQSRAVPALPYEIRVPLPQPAPALSAPSRGAPHAGPHPAEPISAKEAKRIQAEMKITLAALYSSELSFLVEYHRYTTDFRALGYSPKGPTLHAKAGFLRAFSPPNPEDFERPDRLSEEELMKDPVYADYKFSASAEAAHLDDAAPYCRRGCTASETEFEIAIVTLTNGKPDVWTINSDKVLRHETALAP
jgi:hypothetical protein